MKYSFAESLVYIVFITSCLSASLYFLLKAAAVDFGAL